MASYCTVVDYTLTEKFKADGLRVLYKFCFEVHGKVSIILLLYHRVLYKLNILYSLILLLLLTQILTYNLV